jgi:predicted phosphodiesterase
VETVWVIGNHDPNADIISVLMGVRAVEEYQFTSGGQRVLCIHGHQFDKFLVNHPMLTSVADAAYGAIQRVDKSHRLARAAKRGSKRFLAASNAVQNGALKRAKEAGCSIVLCGHTHKAAVVPGEILYGNSGCFTDQPGTWLAVKGGEVVLRECR